MRPTETKKLAQDRITYSINMGSQQAGVPGHLNLGMVMSSPSPAVPLFMFKPNSDLAFCAKVTFAPMWG